ncbi:MAG: PKD domain-containing protein [Candidatus Omnitrophica bacterium]|nr:PKD domain-containing protein [Candidatus Omnitrophota bacterium]
MKKIAVLFLLIIFSAGCASVYKYHTGKPPFNQGYVVSRRGYVIPEYTLGKDNSVPADIKVAQQRFQRRKDTVEDYYKKMGHIKNGFKATVIDSVFMTGEFILGILRWPFTAISDYRYNHNPQYRHKMDRLEQEKENRETERIRRLKVALNKYIEQDLVTKEGLVPTSSPVEEKTVSGQVERNTQEISSAELQAGETHQQAASLVKKEAAETEAEEISAAGLPKGEAQQSSVVSESAALKKLEEEMIQQKISYSPVKCIIVAKPIKGFSPLTVRFNGKKSYSSAGKIVSYAWDFGDGDASTKPNPINTYYSGSVDPRQFTATLTVLDAKGNSATSAVTIEVLNK